ncbi:MAG: hypothetical protein G01um101425_687 [Candidatus Peregrinibacteria bacterium Gr01-1014_25]|nr:MAG: hypothetical protein G01um101425_687 [Candidatus Peregrinibacteria bacterium Gr01-1014_25]
MPLKHATETLLVVGLGIAIALCGILLAVLPPLGISVWPWALLFLFAVLYPAVLYPLLRRRRAEYAFRALHWFPAALCLLWLAAQLLTEVVPSVFRVTDTLTWGWSSPGVALGLLLLAWFSLAVVRQRARRLGVIALLALGFAGVAVAGRAWHMQERAQFALASLLSSAEIAADTVPNLAHSSDEREENWRMSMRRRMRREERLNDRGDVAAHDSLSATVQAAQSQTSALIATTKPSRRGNEALSFGRRVVDAPPRLSHTGPEATGVLLLGLLAAYCGVLHVRVQRRAMS